MTRFKDSRTKISGDNGCTCEKYGSVVYNEKRRTVTMSGYISDIMSEKLVNALDEFYPKSGQSKCLPVSLHINSGGGDIYDALKMHDTVKDFPLPIITIVGGYAHSGATIVFLAGDKRLIYPNATIGFHMVSTGVSGENPFEFQATADHNWELYNKLFKIFLDRVNISRKKLQEYFDVSRRIGAEEAIKIGLAHGIKVPPNKKLLIK